MFSFLKRDEAPGESLSDFQRANQALTRKAYPEALALYVRHAENCPNEAAKAFASAAECCLRSNALATPVAVVPGVTLVSEGNRKGAEYYFRLALRADPSNIRALWGLSELLPEASVERLDLLERVVAKQPGTFNLIALGDFWRTHRKECEKAYQFYKQAVEHNPKDKTAYLRLGDICRRMGREDEAQLWSQRWTEAKKTKRRVDGKSDGVNASTSGSDEGQSPRLHDTAASAADAIDVYMRVQTSDNHRLSLRPNSRQGACRLKPKSPLIPMATSRVTVDLGLIPVERVNHPAFARCAAQSWPELPLVPAMRGTATCVAAH